MIGDDYRWKAFKRANFFIFIFFCFFRGGSSIEHMVVFSIGWGSGILSGSSPHQIGKPIRDLAVSHHPPPQTLSFHPGNAVPLLY